MSGVPASGTQLGPFALNTVIEGDCVTLLKQLPDSCVDLIFADPPYNLQIQDNLYRPNATRVNGVSDSWDKFTSFREYDEFTVAWLSECRRVLKPGGTIWVIGSYHNIFRIGNSMQNLDFWLLNDIVWIKSNPMPNFKGTRFNNAHETLIWAARDKSSKYTFHYHSLKVMNDDLQMRSDWYLPICTGPERIKVNGSKAHSTQKPVELLYRIILACSNRGDVILDPFSGSGTTAATAKLLNRNFLAFEREPFYVSVSRERLESITPLTAEVTEHEINFKKPRVPLGSLVESGLLLPGETLYSHDRKHTAVLQSDATVLCNNLRGSIHKVGGSLNGRSTLNGWSYWCVLRNGTLVVLDELRNTFLQNGKDAQSELPENNDKAE